MGNGAVKPTPDDVFDKVVDKSQYETLRDVDWGIENLVFEGCGARAIAYAGVAKALEDVGILKKCRRFAGSSAGAVLSLMLAIGMKPVDILEVQLADMKGTFYDSNCCCFLPNMLWKHGYLPGEKAFHLFRSLCEKYVGDPDITFKGLHKKRGVELCFTITNVNTGRLEHFHPKTTPHFSIALATRTAMSLPLIYQPIIVKRLFSSIDEKTCLIDGGMVDNFPLSCFDGWYLNMDHEYSYLNMLNTKRPRFDEFNKKTLGILVFDAYEHDMYLEQFMQRMDWLDNIQRPDTKIAKSRNDDVIKALNHRVRLAKIKVEVDEFLNIIKQINLSWDGRIKAKELKDALCKISTKTLNVLFGNKGKPISVDDFVNEMDFDNDGEITHVEVIRFCEDRSVSVKEIMRSCRVGTPINSLLQFSVTALYQCGDMEKRYLREKEGDLGRIIGVYSDYISTLDFNLTTDDKIFGVKLGWDATIAYLKQKAIHEKSKSSEKPKNKQKADERRKSSVKGPKSPKSSKSSKSSKSPDKPWNSLILPSSPIK